MDRLYGHMILHVLLWTSTEFFASSLHFLRYVITSELWVIIDTFLYLSHS